MKHLKKVQLLRVGFDEKVSLVDKFFICDMPSMIKGNDLSPEFKTMTLMRFPIH